MPIPPFVKHRTEDTRHPILNIVVTTMYRAEEAQLFLSWNLGPRRGKEGAIDKHIAGKRHIIALQEAIEYLEHDYLTSHFYVTHFAGCAVLFNKDTFSLGQQSHFRLPPRYQRSAAGRERKTIRVGATSCHTASFQRLPRNGKSLFTTMSLRCLNVVNLNTDHGCPRGGKLFTKSELGETNPWP